MAGAHRLQSDLEHANMTAPIKALYCPDSSGNYGHPIYVKSGDPTDAEAGYHKGALAIDITNGTIKYNSGTIASTTWTALNAGSITLDNAFDNGKVINAANSAGNAVQIGDGSDAVLIYTASSIPTIATNGTSDLTIAPDGGDVNVTGNLAVSGNLAVTGTLSGTVSVTSAPLATITADCTVQAGQTFTVAGTAGSTVNTITAGDMVMSDGSLAITDADNATSLSLTNNTITSGALIDITSTSLTTGTGLRMTADGLTSGTMVLLDSTVSGWSGGYYFRCYDGAADDLTIGQYGAVVIAGNASTDVLTITTGDVQIDDGKLEIDTNEDDTTYVKRNQGTTTGPAVEIEVTNTSDTENALLIDYNCTGAGTAMNIDSEATGDAVVITSAAEAASALKATGEHATTTVLEAIGAASATVSLATITNGGSAATGWLGADGVGMLHLTNDGNLAHANASCLMIEYSGTGAATGLGTSLRVVDTGATATSYAVYISAATGEALKVDAGKCVFDEQIEISGGFKTTTGAFTLTDSGADSMDIDGGAANDTLNIGSTTATDVVFHGSGAAGEDMTWDSSGSSLSFAAGAALVLPQGTGSGGSGRQDVTGSLFYETDAKKLWVYDGAGWVGVAVA